MHGCQARTFSRVIEPSQLVMAPREIPVAPFHIGAGALKHLRERFGLVFELVLLHRAQRAQGPPDANSGVRRRSASVRSGSPWGTGRVEATRSRSYAGMRCACMA